MSEVSWYRDQDTEDQPKRVTLCGFSPDLRYPFSLTPKEQKMVLGVKENPPWKISPERDSITRTGNRKSPESHRGTRVIRTLRRSNVKGGVWNWHRNFYPEIIIVKFNRSKSNSRQKTILTVNFEDCNDLSSVLVGLLLLFYIRLFRSSDNEVSLPFVILINYSNTYLSSESIVSNQTIK